MSERTTIYGNKVYLRNVMADGVILEDMEGFVLTYCEETKDFYNTLAHITMEVVKRESKEVSKQQEENQI